MKEKLSNVIGSLGVIVWYIISEIIYIIPFIMIGASFWLNILFFGIVQFFPASSIFFWVWGLICASNGIQDVWSTIYYILFVIVFLPFIILTVYGKLGGKQNVHNVIRNKLQPNDDAARKANLFRDTVRNEIIALQKDNMPSCEDLIMKEIDSRIRSQQDEFEEWENDIDFYRVSIANLYNITFDMVASGQYHLYRGILNPIGQQLNHVCRESLKKACNKGYITQEEMHEQFEILSDRIRNVG